jgi:antitoxin VapB
VVPRFATSIPAAGSVPESCRSGTSRELHRAADELSAAYGVAKTTMGSKANVYGPQSCQSMVPFNLRWYHASMALNIKDPETERLAAEVAALTGTTKTGAVRYALRQVLEAQSRPSVRQREERLTRFLEEEIWPLMPPDQLGKPVSKAEREEILGFVEHGA